MPAPHHWEPRPGVQLTFTADDFGLSESVNEAVELAHTSGLLNAASLMVNGPAASDAMRRAKALPTLRVGLHLVVIEGHSTLPHARIPDLVDAQNWFDASQFRKGLAYFFLPAIRRQLAAEIAAQFAAFAATGLTLDHANAHKHMHLHPTVGRLMIDIGKRHGLTRIRVPAEPPAIMAACGTRPDLGARALYRWTSLLRAQARAAALATDDRCFGLAWTGHMTPARVAELTRHLGPGTSELYFHPATRHDGILKSLMPSYSPTQELAALLQPDLFAGSSAHPG